ncbi:MAG: outer-membrane lipoprotein carrier protein LolA [Fibromonadaceae bacterium]|jgi:outer membrane lipoprotein carrier protein|nr:outer-membrane lipoprotein carrier protein LolA [Fibromonadaceae bacterium]
MHLKILTIFLLTLAPVFASQADSLLKCSVDYFGKDAEVKFDFQMLTRVASTGEEIQRSGTLLTANNNRFALTMPDMQILSDGVNLWQYNPLQKQVLIRLISDLENQLQPTEVLFRYLNTKAISAKRELWKGRSVHVLNLNPDKYKDQFRAMEVWLSPNDCSPVRLFTKDNFNNDVWYSVENLSKGKFTEKDFKFKSPPGTDEIDMR